MFSRIEKLFLRFVEIFCCVSDGVIGGCRCVGGDDVTTRHSVELLPVDVELKRHQRFPLTSFRGTW